MLVRSHAAQAVRGQRGFTLIELLMTLVVASVLIGLAVPSIERVSQNMKLNSFANEMVGSAHLARGEAIKRNAVVVMCVLDPAAPATAPVCGSGTWNQGYVLLCKTSDNATCDNTIDPNGAGANLIIQKKDALPAGWKVTESASLESLNFKPTGTGVTAATFTVCRLTPSVSAAERVVRISATGRPSVTKTENASCQ